MRKGKQNQFLLAKRLLEDIERMEKKKSLKKDWNESWTEYRRRIRTESRENILNKRIPDRKCPVCGEVKLSSSCWVFIDARLTKKIMQRATHQPISEVILNKTLEQGIICRGCYVAHFTERKWVKR